MSNHGWIGVDLDGTLAHYDGWQGVYHIGAPVPAMLARVKNWIAEGREVRIFTARVHGGEPEVRATIESWCAEHIGVALPVTNLKDYQMVELWDDRAVQVIPNTGARADAPAVENELAPFLVVHAVRYMQDFELNGLHPTHYDLLIKHGAGLRLIDFKRATNAKGAAT